MKKILSICLMCVLMLGLATCGANNGGQVSGNEQSSDWTGTTAVALVNAQDFLH